MWFSPIIKEMTLQGGFQDLDLSSSFSFLWWQAAILTPCVASEHRLRRKGCSQPPAPITPFCGVLPSPSTTAIQFEGLSLFPELEPFTGNIHLCHDQRESQLNRKRFCSLLRRQNLQRGPNSTNSLEKNECRFGKLGLLLVGEDEMNWTPLWRGTSLALSTWKVKP